MSYHKVLHSKNLEIVSLSLRQLGRRKYYKNIWQVYKVHHKHNFLNSRALFLDFKINAITLHSYWGLVQERLGIICRHLFWGNMWKRVAVSFPTYTSIPTSSTSSGKRWMHHKRRLWYLFHANYFTEGKMFLWSLRAIHISMRRNWWIDKRLRVTICKFIALVKSKQQFCMSNGEHK